MGRRRVRYVCASVCAWRRPSHIRTRDRVGKCLGFGVGCDTEFALQYLRANLVLPERLPPAPGPGIGAHQGALSEFGQRVEHYQATTGPHRGIVLLAAILLLYEPMQDPAHNGEGTVALCCQPF